MVKVLSRLTCRTDFSVTLKKMLSAIDINYHFAEIHQVRLYNTQNKRHI